MLPSVYQKNPRRQIRIGPGRGYRDILRALRHRAFAWSPLPPARQPAALAQICARNAVGIDVEQSVIAERSDVGDAQRRVAVELLLDGEVPFVDRGVLALACTPCGAKVVQGVGTPGPQDGEGCTPDTIGRIEGRRRPENEAEPL